MASIISFSGVAILASLLPAASAHMALWSPAAYGFAQPYEPVTPLAGLPFDKWWFHGNAADKPSESITITAGQPLTVEISCNKKYSTYGNETSPDACPTSDFYHAGGTGQLGWGGNDETKLMGCALAIAPTANAAITKPEDFTVMSVLSKCVRNRDTVFPIPANLPACPAGGCTCAWFWATPLDAIFMTGFKCDVEGGAMVPFPKALPPKKGAIRGPTQPIFWANLDGTNIDYVPTETTRPTYTAEFGWEDGAQSAAFGAVAENPAPAPASQAPAALSSVAAVPSSVAAVPSSIAAAPSSIGAVPSSAASSGKAKPTKVCTPKKRSRVFQESYTA